MSTVRTTQKSTGRRRLSRQDAASLRYFGRPQGDIAPGGRPITVTPKIEKPAERESLPHFWHPERAGVRLPPTDFANKLAAIHRDLRVCRPPARAPLSINCWLLWVKKPSITHPLCAGWSLLMAWAYNGRPLDLDEKLFAAIYHFDARNAKSAVAYFDRIIAERDRGIERQRKTYANNLHAQSREWRDSTKISNLGSGSKFALHHDGTVNPSRGELNWNRERERRTLPSELLRELREHRQ